MASVLTTKSKPTLCLSHQLDTHTAFSTHCHLFRRKRSARATPGIGHQRLFKENKGIRGYGTIAANNRALGPAYTGTSKCRTYALVTLMPTRY